MISVRPLALAFLAGALALTPADAAPPAAQDVLFDRPHLADIPGGTTLVYRFEREVSDPALLGAEFQDEIRLDVNGPASDGMRDVAVRVFSGERARDPVPVSGVTINPVVVVFLDRELTTLVRLTGANPAYLKNHFRLAFRDNAQAEPAEIVVDGKSVEAQRIGFQPFLNDPSAHRMKGFHRIRYEFVTSEAVPGGIYEMSATIDGAGGKPIYRERILFTGTAKP